MLWLTNLRRLINSVFLLFWHPCFHRNTAVWHRQRSQREKTADNKCIHFLPRVCGLMAPFLGLLGMNRCRSCLIPSLSFLREEAKFIWDGDSTFGLEGHLETIGLVLSTVLAIKELSLLNGQGGYMRRGGPEACLGFSGTYISFWGVKYKFMRNTWDGFLVWNYWFSGKEHFWRGRGGGTGEDHNL